MIATHPSARFKVFHFNLSEIITAWTWMFMHHCVSSCVVFSSHKKPEYPDASQQHLGNTYRGIFCCTLWLVKFLWSTLEGVKVEHSQKKTKQKTKQFWWRNWLRGSIGLGEAEKKSLVVTESLRRSGTRHLVAASTEPVRRHCAVSAFPGLSDLWARWRPSSPKSPPAASSSAHRLRTEFLKNNNNTTHIQLQCPGFRHMCHMAACEPIRCFFLRDGERATVASSAHLQ